MTKLMIGKIIMPKPTTTEVIMPKFKMAKLIVAKPIMNKLIMNRLIVVKLMIIKLKMINQQNFKNNYGSINHI